MKDVSNILFIVQARLSSSRVPRKMIRNIGDTSMFEICLKKLKTSTVIPIKNIYVSVYDDELKDVAKKHGINIYHRSKESATANENQTTIFEWYDKFDYEYVVLINACQPFLSIETVDRFVNDFLKTDSENMFGVLEKKNYFWDKEGSMINCWTEKGLDTKLVQPVYEAAHSLYASRIDLIKDQNFMGSFKKKNEPELWIMKDEQEIFDVDYEWQFQMAKNHYEKK